MHTPPFISWLDLALCAFLLVANAGITLALRLGLVRSLLVAGTRAIVQLLLIGAVLKTVFALQSPWLVAGVIAFMLISASYEIYSRQQRKLKGWWGFGIGSFSIMLAALVAVSASLWMVPVQPWWQPATLIPMVGIMLGNIMSSISLTLNALTQSLVRERSAIEARLALGHAKRDVFRHLQQQAMRQGLIPIINQMSAAGIVTLPGMMTGQILGGMPPLEAAKYQVMVLFLIGASATFGALVASAWVLWRITDPRDRLRLDQLQPLKSTFATQTH